MSNPYQSLASNSYPWPPRLTRGQRKTLEFALDHRSRKLRWRDVLRFVAPTWGIMSLLFLAVFAVGVLMRAIDREIVSDVMHMVLGMMFGWFAWQVIALSQLVQLWPLIDRAVDWEQVEQSLSRS